MPSMNVKNSRSQASEGRKVRCGRINAMLTNSGRLNVCPTAVWEARTPEVEEILNEFKICFNKYDVNKKGKITIDNVYDIITKAFGQRPEITSVVNIVSSFSADKECELNLAEFLTMGKFLGNSLEMALYFSESEMNDDVDCTKRINAAIKMHEKSKQGISERLAEKLGPIDSIINMQDISPRGHTDKPNPMDTEFDSVYGPNQMRCLALVSHNGMKQCMLKFVRANKNILKKFRLTGTDSTMTMLSSVFEGDDSVVFGPRCMSGPLGGDAQLVSMLCEGKLGGVIFFQDPLDIHPHVGDIEGLLRSIKIYNVMHASTTMSATMLMHTLRIGLEQGRPEMLPSFFGSFRCPSVNRYVTDQKKVVQSNVAESAIDAIKDRVINDEHGGSDDEGGRGWVAPESVIDVAKDRERNDEHGGPDDGGGRGLDVDIFAKMDRERGAETRASIRALVAQMSAKISADELLGLYEGREEVLLRNLSKMKAKEGKNVQTKEEIDALLQENTVARDMAATLKEHYKGREEALLRHLGRMKAERESDAESMEEIGR